MQRKYYILLVFILVVFITGIYFYTQQSKDKWPPPNVVKEPGEGGQWVLINELIVLASGQDVELLVSKFGGEITHSVLETGTYQARFPVSSLDELDIIADKLREKEKGIQVMHAFVIEPPKPGEPQ